MTTVEPYADPLVPLLLSGELRTGEVPPVAQYDHTGQWNDEAVAWDDDRFDFTGYDLYKPSLHTFAYTAADGSAVAIEVMRGMSGRFMPSVDVLTDEVPGQPGFRYRAARHIGRTLLLPALADGIFTDEGADRMAELVATLDPTKGVGTLQTYTVRNGYREITAVYTGGLEAAQEVRPVGLVIPLTFECPDPYWHDRIDQSLVLMGSQFGHAVNLGNALAWPVITVTGGGTGFWMSARRTGAGSGPIETLIEVAGNPDGLRIDTRPGQKSVTRNGANAFPDVSITSKLFPLPPGSTQLSPLRLNPDSFTTVTWQRSWLTP